MARRRVPDPSVTEPLREPVRTSAARIALLERRLADERAIRDAAIRAALAAEDPPTHAQIAEDAGLSRGGISAYAPSKHGRG